jgi:hypothetical protein
MSNSKIGAAALLALVLFGFSAFAHAEVVQRGNLRVKFQGELTPRSLPRASAANVRASVAARISTSGSVKAKLRRMSIAINRYGHLDRKGLPVCHPEEIQPATNGTALEACSASLVGNGSFEANVRFEGQAALPKKAKLFAFNGELGGRPAILAHVYGSLPGPTSYTIPFVIGHARGTFGTILRATMPKEASRLGEITGISMSLGRSYTYRGEKHHFLSASCPAPKGFPGAVFPFARASFAFSDGRTVSSTESRTCDVRD